MHLHCLYFGTQHQMFGCYVHDTIPDFVQIQARNKNNKQINEMKTGGAHRTFIFYMDIHEYK